MNHLFLNFYKKLFLFRLALERFLQALPIFYLFLKTFFQYFKLVRVCHTFCVFILYISSFIQICNKLTEIELIFSAHIDQIFLRKICVQGGAKWESDPFKLQIEPITLFIAPIDSWNKGQWSRDHMGGSSPQLSRVFYFADFYDFKPVIFD